MPEPRSTSTPTYDPVLSLLADATELVAAAREEYAAIRRDGAVEAHVAELLHAAVPDEATFTHARETRVGHAEFVQVTR